MFDFSGLSVFFKVVFELVIYGFFFLIVKHKVLKLTYKTNEYGVSKYFQEASGFPRICKWLHFLELPLLILLNTFDLMITYEISLNDILCIFLVLMNCIMRYKANKSMPITWWFTPIKD